MRVRIGSRHMQQRSAQPFQVIICLALYGISACHGAAQFEMLFVSGDSISRAFNAEDDPKSADRCSLTSLKDHLDLSWHSNTANPSGPCSQPDPVKSYTEYMQCARNSTTVPATFNIAQTGSKMVENVVEQVTEVRNLVINRSLNAKAKKLTILLGHNDYCNGYGTYSSWPAKGLCTGQRNNCMELSDGADRDPDYYCSIRPSAYERELRKALGIAATIPNMTVELASPVRVSQLCGLRDIAKNTLLNKDRPITCRQFDNVLNTESYLVNLFKSQPQPGVCKPLTYVDNRASAPFGCNPDSKAARGSCSKERLERAYARMKAYRNILVKLRREYGSLKAGARIAGRNGAAVASNFRVTHNDALWKVKLSTIQLSTCDCFHPNKLGQNMLARVMYGGLDCSKGEPACCMDEGMRGEDGKVVTRLQAAQCAVLDTHRKIAPAI